MAHASDTNLVDTDLIAAVATANGQGGVGVIRLSGPGAKKLAESMCGKTLLPRLAMYCEFSDATGLLDSGLALWFPHGQSFTGEETVELQVHGSPVGLQNILDVCCQRGARLARPGEFSERAFLNGKVDLAQAEAIADLIASGSKSAAKAAARSLRGDFSKRIETVATALESLRVVVEACIDFPDEEVDFLETAQIEEKIEHLVTEINRTLVDARQGRLVNEGAALALVGAPNVGKSSLLNLLSGEDAAIVTEIPGTTRDVLKVEFSVAGVPLQLADTAGLRDSEDIVEQLGMARSREQARIADIVLLMLDTTTLIDIEPLHWGKELEYQTARAMAHLSQQQPDHKSDPKTGKSAVSPADLPDRVVIVVNKLDLLNMPSAQQLAETLGHAAVVWISVKQATGIEKLKHCITEILGRSEAEAPFTARARHVAALEAAMLDLQTAQANLRAGQPGELIAEELRAAHLQLGEIVGVVTPDDLLGKIFSQFCIGK